MLFVPLFFWLHARIPLAFEEMLVFSSVFELQRSCPLFPNMHADNEPTVWSWTAPHFHIGPLHREAHHATSWLVRPLAKAIVGRVSATAAATPSKFKETRLDWVAVGGGGLFVDETAAGCWNQIVFWFQLPQLDTKAPQSHFDLQLSHSLALVWPPACQLAVHVTEWTQQF